MRQNLFTKIFPLTVSLFLCLPCQAEAITQADLISGFRGVVFGAEYNKGSWQSRVVKKFSVPVRFYIDDRSGSPTARAETNMFLRSLQDKIQGLSSSITSSPRRANFRILLVRRSDYDEIVDQEVLGQREARAPGECLVRIVASPSGIVRSDAVVVTDAAGGLFRKCLIEEILQGLGTINDDAALAGSVFNDATRIHEFTPFDQAILNALYHPKIRAGMSMGEVNAVLPSVLNSVQAGVN